MKLQPGELTFKAFTQVLEETDKETSNETMDVVDEELQYWLKDKLGIERASIAAAMLVYGYIIGRKHSAEAKQDGGLVQ